MRYQKGDACETNYAGISCGYFLMSVGAKQTQSKTFHSDTRDYHGTMIVRGCAEPTRFGVTNMVPIGVDCQHRS